MADLRQGPGGTGRQGGEMGGVSGSSSGGSSAAQAAYVLHLARASNTQARLCAIETSRIDRQPDSYARVLGVAQIAGVVDDLQLNWGKQ